MPVCSISTAARERRAEGCYRAEYCEMLQYQQVEEGHEMASADLEPLRCSIVDLNATECNRMHRDKISSPNFRNIDYLQMTPRMRLQRR